MLDIDGVAATKRDSPFDARNALVGVASGDSIAGSQTSRSG